MKKRFFILLVLCSLFLGMPGSALAQTYYFKVPQAVIHAFWNADGTLSIDYTWVFENESNDRFEYVDLGIPTSDFDASSIYADVNGKAIAVSQNDYEGSGSGVALVLGNQALRYGQTGTVHAYVGVVRRVLHPDDDDEDYASAVFSPTWFGSSYVDGKTDMTVVFHLPPDIQPGEPRWHKAPDGFNSEPETGFDREGRITYTWRNANANSYTEYDFGASFPKKYVPESAIVRFSFLDAIFGLIGSIFAAGSQCCIPLLFMGGFAGLTVWSLYSDRKRRQQYLPPKISIEGHGIKRGLTAVEAAVLMEQPVDTVLTMILFALIKKNAAEVTTREPLEVKAAEPLPGGLRTYEQEFVEAFDKKGAERRRAMQTTMINLVKSVTEKMKGFSRRETVAYYKQITEKAWRQVEAANTPEVKSQKFDEVMEWTMLDRDFNDRTRDIFRHQPVFVPLWWGRFDPGFERRTQATLPSGGSRPQAGPLSGNLRIPGSDFAASIVTGIEGFAGSVIGNVTDFTNRVVGATNPLPKSSSGSGGHRSSGGGSSCACACACAGCACACAGGGR
ncbi:MAG: hypothetical protein ACOYYS_27130 [Chloroflexota bacterium]